MLPKWHLLFALIASVPLLPILSWKALIFLAAAVLIDFDHYIIYVAKKKDVNLKRGYTFLKKLEEKQRKPNFNNRYTFFLCIFHTYEFLLVIFVLSFIYNPLFAVFTGFIFHLMIDFIHAKMDFKEDYLAVFLKNLSFMYYLFSRNKKGFGELKLEA